MHHVCKMLVSIPHRYCKNEVHHIIYLTPDNMFQFLIGTVKTIADQPPSDAMTKFQFLIGTVKTERFTNL